MKTQDLVTIAGKEVTETALGLTLLRAVIQPLKSSQMPAREGVTYEAYLRCLETAKDMVSSDSDVDNYGLNNSVIINTAAMVTELGATSVDDYCRRMIGIESGMIKIEDALVIADASYHDELTDLGSKGEEQVLVGDYYDSPVELFVGAELSAVMKGLCKK